MCPDALFSIPLYFSIFPFMVFSVAELSCSIFLPVPCCFSVAEIKFVNAGEYQFHRTLHSQVHRPLYRQQIGHSQTFLCSMTILGVVCCVSCAAAKDDWWALGTSRGIVHCIWRSTALYNDYQSVRAKSSSLVDVWAVATASVNHDSQGSFLGYCFRNISFSIASSIPNYAQVVHPSNFYFSFWRHAHYFVILWHPYFLNLAAFSLFRSLNYKPLDSHRWFLPLEQKLAFTDWCICEFLAANRNVR